MRRALQLSATAMRSRSAARRQAAAAATTAANTTTTPNEQAATTSPTRASNNRSPIRQSPGTPGNRQTSTSPVVRPIPGSPIVTTTEKKQRRPPPLYAWETQEQEQIHRIRIANDFGTYLPTENLGFYKIASVAQESTENTHIDVQIFLSETEFQAVLSRRRSFRAETRHSKRFVPTKQEESPYLMASTPYIDPKRVKEALYRPAQREKWMSQPVQASQSS